MENFKYLHLNVIIVEKSPVNDKTFIFIQTAIMLKKNKRRKKQNKTIIYNLQPIWAQTIEEKKTSINLRRFQSIFVLFFLLFINSTFNEVFHRVSISICYLHVSECICIDEIIV